MYGSGFCLKLCSSLKNPLFYRPTDGNNKTVEIFASLRLFFRYAWQSLILQTQNRKVNYLTSLDVKLNKSFYLRRHFVYAASD